MGSEPCIKFAVLYTKNLTKKRKTYYDGFVTVRGSKDAALIDESGAILCKSASTAAASSLTVGATGVFCSGE